MDVPGDVDYVMLAVPRQVAPRVLADCAKKGVGGVALFTSGFAETGEEEGIKLQEQVLQIARDGDMTLIGPNCMGLYNRRLGIRQSGEQGAGEAGDVGFISPERDALDQLRARRRAHGVRVSTSISIGNAIILDVPDYLDYLADDAETKVIAMYIEGVKDGPRFVRSLRRAASMKPVVVWKGGVTDAGARATASHTGSLATPQRGVRARSCGRRARCRRDSLEDTIDVVKALLYAKPATGARMGLMAMTGGQSVVITDAFVSAGLRRAAAVGRVVRAAASRSSTSSAAATRTRSTWAARSASAARRRRSRKLFDILDADPNVDAIAMEMASGFLARMWKANPASLDGLLDTLSAHRDKSSKPFVAVLQPQHVEDVVRAGAHAGAGARHRGVRVVRARGARAEAGDRLPPVRGGAGLTRPSDCLSFCAFGYFGALTAPPNRTRAARNADL